MGRQGERVGRLTIGCLRDLIVGSFCVFKKGGYLASSPQGSMKKVLSRLLLVTRTDEYPRPSHPFPLFAPPRVPPWQHHTLTLPTLVYKRHCDFSTQRLPLQASPGTYCMLYALAIAVIRVPANIEADLSSVGICRSETAASESPAFCCVLR